MKPKTAKRDQAATPLPEVEWDFYELGNEETSLAFYYEYGRSSEAVKFEVEKMRSNRKKHCWHYCPREHRLWEVISWLAHRESFPAVPWLALPGNGSLERLCFLRTATDLRPGIGCKEVWFGDEEAVRTMLDQRAQTSVPAPQDEIELYPETSLFEIVVNWHLTNAEIVEMFADIVKLSRSKRFESYAKTPLVQRGFRDEPFPFRKGAALQWLGVQRRRNAVKTWNEYLDLYPSDESKALDNARKKPERAPLKPYEEENRKFDEGNARKKTERARREDCDKARLILDWFDNGVPLRKEDFK